MPGTAGVTNARARPTSLAARGLIAIPTPGLAPGSRLEAGLHTMLVYGRGQSFLPHRDSEKDDAVIGTLVVTLPSPHTGGELIVGHGGQSIAYRSPTDSLSFIARGTRGPVPAGSDRWPAAGITQVCGADPVPAIRRAAGELRQPNLRDST